MDRITRKTLKTDKFAAEVTESVEFLAEHRRQALLYGGAIVAALAIGATAFFYFQRSREAAHEALAKALVTQRAIVAEEDRPGRVTFKTEAEKNAKALREFEAVVKDFPRLKEAKVARYYIGLIHHQMGHPAEAQKQLDKLAGEGHDSVAALARLALADVYLSMGKDEEARKIYEYLIKNPADTVSENRAQLAMAHYWRTRKPEEARKILMELIKRLGPVSGAAGNMLRELGTP